MSFDREMRVDGGTVIDRLKDTDVLGMCALVMDALDDQGGTNSSLD